MSTLMSQARTRVPKFAEDAVARARLSVVPRGETTAARTPFVVMVAMLLVGGVVGLLMFNTSMQQASFTATSLQGKADALAARQQSLQMQLEQLRDPQRLASSAKELGMVAPTNPAFIRLSDGAVLGKPLAASPDDAMRINPLPAKKPDALNPKPLIVRVPATETTKTTRDTAASSTDRTATSDKKKQAVTTSRGGSR